MAIPNVLINGERLAIQPSRVIPNQPRARTQRGLNGAHTSSATTYGWTFDLIFGNAQLSPPGAMDAVKDALGGGAVVQFKYTSEDEVEHTHNVYLPEEVAQAIRWGNLAERLQITLLDTDQEPDGS